MPIKLKTYGILPQCLFITINCLVALLYVISMVLGRLQNQYIYFIGAALVIALLCFDFLAIFMTDSKLKRIAVEMKVFFDNNRYDEAFALLQKYAEKRRLVCISHCILYYAGYIELLRDNVVDAKNYFEQLNFNKYYTTIESIIVHAMCFLYICCVVTYDEIELNNIRSLFYTNKKRIDKLLMRFDKIAAIKQLGILLQAIESYQSGDTFRTSSLLQKTKHMKLPVVQRFVDSFCI